MEQDGGAAGEERADAAGGGHGGDAHGVPQPRRPRPGDRRSDTCRKVCIV